MSLVSLTSFSTPIPASSTMPGTFTYHFDSSTYKGVSTIHTGLFINGEFVDSVDKQTIK